MTIDTDRSLGLRAPVACAVPFHDLLRLITDEWKRRAANELRYMPAPYGPRREYQYMLTLVVRLLRREIFDPVEMLGVAPMNETMRQHLIDTFADFNLAPDLVADTATLLGGVAPERVYASLPLWGKTALVTGAASGIGRAIATRCERDGAIVIAVDRDKNGLKSLAAAHSRIVYHVCDLGNEGEVEALPAHNVDVLVNCAGFLVLDPIHIFSPKVFDKVQRVMVGAPFRLVRMALPHMYERGWGRVINISSVHGSVAAPLKSAYITAKFGLEGLSKVIALEGAEHGVTSTTICPTHVGEIGDDGMPIPGTLLAIQAVEEGAKNGMGAKEYLYEKLLAQPAVPRVVPPAEVADMVAFLYGPSSASISGAPLFMDGAWSAR